MEKRKWKSGFGLLLGAWACVNISLSFGSAEDVADLLEWAASANLSLEWNRKAAAKRRDLKIENRAGDFALRA